MTECGRQTKKQKQTEKKSTPTIASELEYNTVIHWWLWGQNKKQPM